MYHPRINFRSIYNIVDLAVGVGTRVVRGPDWSPDFENQDGGEGHVGSVTEICGFQVIKSVLNSKHFKKKY